MKVTICKGVSRVVAKIVRKLAWDAHHVTPMRHTIQVYVVPAITVSDDGHRFGFAAFRMAGGEPEIWIGGEPPKGVDDLEAYLRENFAHELAHYEQWRDGRTLQERGVEVRARTLATALGKLAGRVAFDGTETFLMARSEG